MDPSGRLKERWSGDTTTLSTSPRMSLSLPALSEDGVEEERGGGGQEKAWSCSHHDQSGPIRTSSSTVRSHV